MERAIWSTTQPKIEIHADGCRALNKATGRRGAVWKAIDDTVLADLSARGYSIYRCKCTATHADGRAR